MRSKNVCTPKGCDKAYDHSNLIVPALQAGLSNLHDTQGVVLGYVVTALQAENNSFLPLLPAKVDGVALEIILRITSGLALEPQLGYPPLLPGFGAPTPPIPLVVP